VSFSLHRVLLLLELEELSYYVDRFKGGMPLLPAASSAVLVVSTEPIGLEKEEHLPEAPVF
jgi:hypothetical protein